MHLSACRLIGFVLICAAFFGCAPPSAIGVSEMVMAEPAREDGISIVQFKVSNHTGGEIVLSREDSERSLSCCTVPEKESKLAVGASTTAAYSVDEGALARDGYFPVRIVYRVNGEPKVFTHRIERDDYVSLTSHKTL